MLYTACNRFIFGKEDKGKKMSNYTYIFLLVMLFFQILNLGTVLGKLGEPKCSKTYSGFDLFISLLLSCLTGLAIYLG